MALRDGERMFSDPALTTSVSHPDKTFRYLVNLLGQKAGSDIVKQYQQRFPFHKIEADLERGTVRFVLEDNLSYSVEELLAMVVEHCMENAVNYAEGTLLNDVVITVPPYFTQVSDNKRSKTPRVKKAFAPEIIVRSGKGLLQTY